MADAEAWQPGRQHRRVTRTRALLATALKVMDVLRAGSEVGWKAVDPTLARQQPDTAGYPQCCTALQHQTVPTIGLAIMVVIMAAARGARQGGDCVGAGRINEVSTDHDTQEPETARLSSFSTPRHYVGTDEAGESTVPHAAVTGTNSLTTDGALDCPAPAVRGHTKRSGCCSRRAAGPRDRWGGGGRDSRQAETEAADGGIDETAVQCRAEAVDSAQLEAQERRCIFINTGPKTIAVHLQAGHTPVDHVRDQVAAREGIATEHQCLMYAG